MSQALDEIRKALRLDLDFAKTTAQENGNNLEAWSLSPEERAKMVKEAEGILLTTAPLEFAALQKRRALSDLEMELWHNLSFARATVQQKGKNLEEWLSPEERAAMVETAKRTLLRFTPLDFLALQKRRRLSLESILDSLLRQRWFQNILAFLLIIIAAMVFLFFQELLSRGRRELESQVHETLAEQITISSVSCADTTPTPPQLAAQWANKSAKPRNMVIADVELKVRDENWDLPKRLRADSVDDLAVAVIITPMMQTIDRKPGSPDYDICVGELCQMKTHGYAVLAERVWHVMVIDVPGNTVLSQTCLAGIADRGIRTASVIGGWKDNGSFPWDGKEGGDMLTPYGFWELLGISDHDPLDYRQDHEWTPSTAPAGLRLDVSANAEQQPESPDEVEGATAEETPAAQ